MYKRIKSIVETNSVTLKITLALAISGPHMESYYYWMGRSLDVSKSSKVGRIIAGNMLAAKTKAVVIFDRELNNEWLVYVDD